MNRQDELRANLRAVEARIRRACDDAGRDRAEVSLIVITKTYPASDVALLAGLGVSDVGENRHPEAGNKRDEVLADRADPRASGLRWHFVGGLQTNKAAAVARYADVVHSVDRIKLVKALDKGARAAGRTLECLIQVGLRDDAGRSGAPVGEVAALADAVEDAAMLRLGGVMTVAPLGADPAAAFAEFVAVAQSLQRRHRNATVISAGMSGDLEQAVKAGATHLRIGRSVLGARPPLG